MASAMATQRGPIRVASCATRTADMTLKVLFSAGKRLAQERAGRQAAGIRCFTEKSSRQLRTSGARGERAAEEWKRAGIMIDFGAEDVKMQR